LSFCDKKFSEKKIQGEKSRSEKNLRGEKFERKNSKNKLKKIDEKTFIFKTRKLG